MKRENFKFLISIVIGMILMMIIVNQAESYRAREYLVDIAVLGDLVIAGKLLAIEGKQDAQTGFVYTDVSVEVQNVIRNVTKQNIKAGTILNFRPRGGDIGDHRYFSIDDATFHKEEIGNLVLLSLKPPHPEVTANRRKGFDTIFDVFGGVWGKYTVKIKKDTPIVLAFWHERRNEEIGLPLDLVLQLMNMALTVSSQNPVRNPKTPEEVPKEIKIKFTRLVTLEESIRKMASDGLLEEAIIEKFRVDMAKVKQELGL